MKAEIDMKFDGRDPPPCSCADPITFAELTSIKIVRSENLNIGSMDMRAWCQRCGGYVLLKPREKP